MILYGIIIVIIIVLLGKQMKESFEDKKSNAMIIVEPRKHKLLQGVISSFNENMDSSWDLYVFHGMSHETYAKEAVKDITKRKVFLHALDTDNLTANNYNYLFKQKNFWDIIKAENILVFQTDSILCKNSLNNIYNFTKYDYIGCSMSKNDYGENHTFNGWGVDRPFYGTGGLSFRKKSFIEKCLNEKKVNDFYPEDILFSECVNTFGTKPESAKILNTFCSQEFYEENSFGAHRIKLINKKTSFLEYCYEANLIKDEGFKNFLKPKI
jgi:hypothetical protein